MSTTSIDSAGFTSVRSGRARVPTRSETARAVLRAEPDGRDGSARFPGHDARQQRSGVHEPLQLVPRVRGDGCAGSGFLVVSGARRARTDGARSAAGRRDLRLGGHVLQERRAPGVATVFMLAIFLVFLILAAQYESWGLPFSVLLGTPFAAVRRLPGLCISRARSSPRAMSTTCSRRSA